MFASGQVLRAPLVPTPVISLDGTRRVGVSSLRRGFLSQLALVSLRTRPLIFGATVHVAPSFGAKFFAEIFASGEHAVPLDPTNRCFSKRKREKKGKCSLQGSNLRPWAY
jgi:hypothetical protein